MKDAYRESGEGQLGCAQGRYRDAIAVGAKRTEPAPELRAEYLAFLYRAAGDGSAAEEHFRALERNLSASLQHEPANRDDVLRGLALAPSLLCEPDAAIRTI